MEYWSGLLRCSWSIRGSDRRIKYYLLSFRTHTIFYWWSQLIVCSLICCCCCCCSVKSYLTATTWTAAHQVFLALINPQSLTKFIFTELVIPSNYLILCHPLLRLRRRNSLYRLPFPMSQLFTLGGQSIGASASAPVLPMSTQCWFQLRLTGLIKKGNFRCNNNINISRCLDIYMYRK